MYNYFDIPALTDGIMRYLNYRVRQGFSPSSVGTEATVLFNLRKYLRDIDGKKEEVEFNEERIEK